MIDLLIFDILHHATQDGVVFNSIINLSSANKYFYNNINVINLYDDIDRKYLRKLNDSILIQQKYANIRYLNAKYNSKITTANHMSKLEILNASSLGGIYCGINDNGLINVNLKELNASYNSKITTINHMTKLEILDAIGFECGINDNGLINI